MNASLVVVRDQIAFVVEGMSNDTTLHIIDISDPGSPKGLGELYVLGQGYGIHLAGDHLYIAGPNNGLSSVDISNLAEPKLAGVLEIPNARAVRVVGNLAYVPAWTWGVKIVDVSDPSQMVVLATYDTPGQARSIDFLSGYAYLSDFYGGLIVFDMADPLAPAWVETIKSPCSESRQVGVVDGELFSVGCGVQFYDLADPAAPEFAWSIKLSSYVRNLHYAEGHAYAVDNNGGVVVVSKAEQVDPTDVLATFRMAYWANGIKVLNGLAYVGTGDHQLSIYDVTDPTAPGYVGGLDANKSDAYDLDLSAGYAYFASFSAGLTVLDATDPTSPKLAGECYLPGAMGVDVVGDRAYIAGRYYGLEILDVSDPEDPVLIGVSDPIDAWGVTVVDDIAFVSAKDGLYLLDVSDGESPYEISAVHDIGALWEVDVQSDLAYLASYSLGLVVVDVTNPESPLVLGSVDSKATTVKVHGHFAYINGGKKGVRIIDVTNPQDPTLHASHPYERTSLGLDISAGYLFTGDGLRIVDVRGCWE